MMDSYTSSMCNASWGRNSFARVIVEVQSDRERKESMVIALPNLEDDGFTRETGTSEYEWYPPRCSKCKIFGHSFEGFPLKVKEISKKNA